MNIRNIFRLGPVLLCFNFATLLHAQAVVENPSFEINSTEGGSTYQPLYTGFLGLPGWRFSSQPSTVLIGNPDPSYAYATPFGMWQVDLTGSDNVAGGWIETVLSGLSSGVSYLLHFNLGTSIDWLGGVSAPPSISVGVTGNAQQNFSHVPTTANERTSLTYTFIAPASGQATVRFTNTSGNGVGFVAIDNMTLQVNAPASLELSFLEGMPRLTFTGELEQSTNLVDWTARPGVTSPHLLFSTNGDRFFRTRKL